MNWNLTRQTTKPPCQQRPLENYHPLSHQHRHSIFGKCSRPKRYLTRGCLSNNLSSCLWKSHEGRDVRIPKNHTRTSDMASKWSCSNCVRRKVRLPLENLIERTSLPANRTYPQAPGFVPLKSGVAVPTFRTRGISSYPCFEYTPLPRIFDPFLLDIFDVECMIE